MLRELLSGETVHHEVVFFPMADAVIRPATPTPILIGGIVEAAIRRAGEVGDGWIMGSFGTPQDFKQGWKIVHEAAWNAGRDPDNLTAGGGDRSVCARR